MTGESAAHIRWHPDNRQCGHFNDDVCPTCDFDGYYASTYPDCPWRESANGFSSVPAFERGVGE